MERYVCCCFASCEAWGLMEQWWGSEILMHVRHLNNLGSEGGMRTKSIVKQNWGIWSYVGVCCFTREKREMELVASIFWSDANEKWGLIACNTRGSQVGGSMTHLTRWGVGYIEYCSWVEKWLIWGRERSRVGEENGREFWISFVSLKSLKNNSVLICEMSSISITNSCT
jgi:hypothetical protein